MMTKLKRSRVNHLHVRQKPLSLIGVIGKIGDLAKKLLARNVMKKQMRELEKGPEIVKSEEMSGIIGKSYGR